MAAARRLVCASVLASALAMPGVALAGQSSDVAALMQTPAVSAALAAARASESQTIADQIRFCEVPAPPFAESDRAEVLRRAFVALRLENVRVDQAGNVLGDRPGASPRPRLVIAAHLDTVFPAGTDTHVTRAGNVLRGPGIGDNCRGLAVLVAIVRSLNDAQVRTEGTLTFVANVGEEGLGDLRGMKALFGRTLQGQVDRFVTIDNAGLSISAIGVGSLRYRVTFKGPGGHSFADFGRPNAANALGRAVAKIAELRVSASPRTTFNVGRIGGGTSVNAIPSEAWMEVDLRSPDAGALADLDRRFQRAVDGAVADENARWGHQGSITAVKELVGNRPAGATPQSSALVQTAYSVAHALGIEVQPSESSSDANLPMSLGIPAIAIGGGGQSWESHAPAEWFDSANSWQGTENALLLTVALARR